MPLLGVLIMPRTHRMEHLYHCGQCNTKFDPPVPYPPCPNCGEHFFATTSTREQLLEAQIKRLRDFVRKAMHGEPVKTDDSVDTAIRLIRDLLKKGRRGNP
jgi:predicted  nucleic acid-binding Zn-ribbon protein